jgi:hypothetical protein
MKTAFLFAVAAGLIAFRAAAFADAIPAPPAVEVIFDHPENFTDVKDRYEATDKGRDSILRDIRSFIVYTATKYYLPAGCHLAMTFTDIDLAGDFEPWRGPQFDDIRIIKDIYPPAFKFSYRVTDASGAVVKQGQERIRDLAFQMRIVIDREDPLRYEKDILHDWMRQTLSDLKKR